MRRTYAYNSIIIGGLVGIYVAVKAGTFLGIVAGIAVSVVGFILIRALENVISDAVDKGADAVSNALHDRKKEKEGKSGSQDLADRYK